MRSKRYTLLLADRSTGTVRRFTVSLTPLLSAVGVLVILPLLMGLGARWAVRAELADLRSSNALLVEQNSSYRAATTELTSQISSLQTAVSELSEHARIDPATQAALEKLPAVTKSRAIGGALSPMGGAALSSAVSSPDATFGVIRDLLSVLEQHLESARPGVERRRALAAATPSIWPVAGWLSSSFGRRSDPFHGGTAFHDGIDIVAEKGRPVVATAEGDVITSGWVGEYGNLVVLRHSFGIETRYAHLSRTNVKAGQTVQRGEVIGFVGSTGRSTSAHLHYEVWLNNRLINPLRLLSTR